MHSFARVKEEWQPFIGNFIWASPDRTMAGSHARTCGPTKRVAALNVKPFCGTDRKASDWVPVCELQERRGKLRLHEQ
jgi:hypothetical protein